MTHCSEQASVAYVVQVVVVPVQTTEPTTSAGLFLCPTHDPNRPQPVDSPHVAMTQQHAMVNDDREVFYPDNPEDARYFAEQHGARPLRPHDSGEGS